MSVSPLNSPKGGRVGNNHSDEVLVFLLTNLNTILDSITVNGYIKLNDNILIKNLISDCGIVKRGERPYVSKLLN